MNRLFKFLVFLLLTLLFSQKGYSAELEGIRWFKHDRFMRLVFDVDQKCEYEINQRLSRGFVEISFVGNFTSSINDVIDINTDVLDRVSRVSGAQFRWKIECSSVSRVNNMALDEKPYKVVLDFYSGIKPASSLSKQDSKPSNLEEIRPVKQEVKSEKATVKNNKSKSNIDQKYGGLKGVEKKRLLIADLLMQIGDTLNAEQYIEKSLRDNPDHAFSKFLYSMILIKKNDLFRAKEELNAVLHDPVIGKEAQEWINRINQPGKDGLLPGGEISEEDLVYFMNVLRKGQTLANDDIYSSAEQTPKTANSRMFIGIMIGIILAASCWAASEHFKKKKQSRLRSEQIIKESKLKDPAETKVEEMASDFSSVSKKAREELEEQMNSIVNSEVSNSAEPLAAVNPPAKAPTSEAADNPDITDEGVDNLEEQVCIYADEEMSIVEIAEKLNIGVDEVRLILELRERAGELGG
jgi:hypothetical protein